MTGVLRCTESYCVTDVRDGLLQSIVVLYFEFC